MAIQSNIRISRASPATVTWTYRDAAGAPISLVGYSSTMRFRQADNISEVVTFDESDYALGGAAGTIVVDFSSIVGTLPAELYDWELIVTTGSTDIPLVSGLCYIEG